MKILLAAALLALSLVSAASAAPDGFRESARLSPIAQALSVPEARVYCGLTASSWRDAVQTLYPEALWSSFEGYTTRAEHGSYLAPWICQPLERWKRGKAVPLADLGRAILTLGHEAVHLRGIYDERTAECTALRELRGIARSHFGIKREKVWRQVRDGALDAYRYAPDEYRGC